MWFILAFICLVPLLVLTSASLWWAFARLREWRWLALAVVFWVAAHALLSFMPNLFTFYGLICGIALAVICALLFFDPRNDYFRELTLVIWLLTPFTLPEAMMLRQSLFSENTLTIYVVTPFIIPFVTIWCVRTVRASASLTLAFVAAGLFAAMVVYAFYFPSWFDGVGFFLLMNVFGLVIGLTICLSEPGMPDKRRLDPMSYYLLIGLLGLLFVRLVG